MIEVFETDNFSKANVERVRQFRLCSLLKEVSLYCCIILATLINEIEAVIDACFILVI